MIRRQQFLALATLLNILSLAPAAEQTATLIFTGDAMLAETIGAAIGRGEDPFVAFDPIFKAADLCVCNLECVVSTTGKPVADKPYTFQAHPRVLPLLTRRFGAVSLANNHTGDFGHRAFLEQLGLLDEARLPHFGGGRNNAEARRPLLVQLHGIRIALLAYNDFHPRCFEAGPDWPGVAWCVPAQVLADIRAARRIHHADLVIPFLHWGEEEEPATARQKQLARQMLRAGADLVVGAHPHVVQSIEYDNGKLIAYSLGNFVFDGFPPGPGRIGWVLRLRLDKKGLTDWDTIVARLDDQGFPHPDFTLASPAGNARLGTLENRTTCPGAAFPGG